MDNLSKVSIDKKIRNRYVIKISVVGTISLIGLVLGIVSITQARILFAVWYFIAFLLGLSYSVIQINSAFPQYIAADGEKLILSMWKNCVLPYHLPEKANIFSDFIPEKIKTEEILISDIEAVYIGSKKFLKTKLAEEDYPFVLKRLDEDRHTENMTKRMYFIYICVKGGESCFMSVTNFDVNGLAQLTELIEQNCAGVQIHTNMPKLVKIRNKINKL